eukprot:m.269428 g.269428  ORF g.269428 m.269428 type:complete len:226 (+) comp17661_c1_seq45:715-1392(+)
MDKLSSSDLVHAQAKYWEKQSQDVDGMLGGYGHVAEIDVASSQKLLATLLTPEQAARGISLDCGAGIGRITKDLLLPFGFQQVDLLDVSPTFLATAKEALNSSGRLGNTYCSGMAEFDFDKTHNRRWTTIWIQWCAIYLTDKALVEFFNRAADALTDDGVIVLKENVLKGDSKRIEDHDDQSVTRSDKHLRKLFKKTKLKMVACKRQPNMPEELYPVYMYAFKKA